MPNSHQHTMHAKARFSPVGVNVQAATFLGFEPSIKFEE